jgi:hypothetical protein
LEAPQLPAKLTTSRSRFLWVIGAVGLFGVACFLPALKFPGENNFWPGGATFCMGFLGFLVGEFGWLANFALIASWISMALAHYKTALVLSAIALLLALDTFALYVIAVPADESGTNPPVHLQSLGPGFWLWLTSILVIVAGAFLCRRSAAQLQVTQ